MEGKREPISHRGARGDLFKKLHLSEWAVRIPREESKQKRAGSAKALQLNHPPPRRSNTAHVTNATEELSVSVLSSDWAMLRDRGRNCGNLKLVGKEKGITNHVYKYELLCHRVLESPGTMIWRLHNSLGLGEWMQGVWEYFRENWALAGRRHVGMEGERGDVAVWCSVAYLGPVLIRSNPTTAPDLHYLTCPYLFGKWRWQQGHLDIVRTSYVYS